MDLPNYDNAMKWYSWTKRRLVTKRRPVCIMLVVLVLVGVAIWAIKTHQPSPDITTLVTKVKRAVVEVRGRSSAGIGVIEVPEKDSGIYSNKVEVGEATIRAEGGSTAYIGGIIRQGEKRHQEIQHPQEEAKSQAIPKSTP